MKIFIKISYCYNFTLGYEMKNYKEEKKKATFDIVSPGNQILKVYDYILIINLLKKKHTIKFIFVISARLCAKKMVYIGKIS